MRKEWIDEAVKVFRRADYLCHWVSREQYSRQKDTSGAEAALLSPDFIEDQAIHAGIENHLHKDTNAPKEFQYRPRELGSR